MTDKRTVIKIVNFGKIGPVVLLRQVANKNAGKMQRKILGGCPALVWIGVCCWSLEIPTHFKVILAEKDTHLFIILFYFILFYFIIYLFIYSFIYLFIHLFIFLKYRPHFHNFWVLTLLTKKKKKKIRKMDPH